MEKLFDVLLDRALQEEYLESRIKQKPHDKRNPALREYLLGEGLRTDVERLRRGDFFLDLPSLKETPKGSNGEKRSLYIFRGTNHFLLAFMSYALIHVYDPLFSDGLYSFRLKKNRRALIERVHAELKGSDTHPYFAFKTDIKGYSKSIDQDILLEKLSAILGHDPELMRFLT